MNLREELGTNHDVKRTSDMHFQAGCCLIAQALHDGSHPGRSALSRTAYSGLYRAAATRRSRDIGCFEA